MKPRFHLTLLPLLASAALVVLPSFAHAEDLLDAYQQARASDPVLAQANALRLQVAEGVPLSRSALLPRINAGVNYNYDRGSSNTTIDPTTGQVINLGGGNAHSHSLSATLNQTIFNYADYANLAASESAADAQAAQYHAAEQNLIVRVAQAYFDVLTAEDEVSFAEAQEKALSRQLDQAQERYKVGMSAITDVNEAKANYDVARANTITAKNTLSDMREALMQITGQPLGTLEKLRDELPLTPPQPADQKQWVEMALQQNPLVQAQRYQVQASEHDISAARAGHYPTLDASVSYVRRPNTFGDDLPGMDSHIDSTSIGLSLSIPIFNGGATHARVRQAIYARDANRDALEQQRRQIIRGTRSAYRSVIAGISEVEAREQAVVSAQSALEATQAGFQVGTRNIIDVLTGQQQLFQAQSAYSQARHNFIINKLALKQSAGTIDIADLKAVNALLVPLH
ncbi:MAG TPA: TolC family outer membrane protein [Rhodanobacteraceae bacterium]|nr:TolC family outer membrane protein [Rhodanobacteraceae bacterium]